MRVLVFAPHADDEILGCGGTMAKNIANGDEVYVCVATRPVPPVFPDEAFFHQIRTETLAAHKLLGITKTFFLELPSVMIENVPRYEQNRRVSEVMNEVRPDIVYLPHFGDMQRDHALVAEAVMVAVRPKNAYKVRAVYAYETLSETEWNVPHGGNAFLPTVYSDISDYLETKKQAMACYVSQLGVFPEPRSVDALEALAKYRGSTILTKAAEAFALIREIC